MSKFPGHHSTNHTRGSLPQLNNHGGNYPSGVGIAPGGVNNSPGISNQGIAGRVPYPAGRTTMPPFGTSGLGAGGGAVGPGGFAPTAGIPYPNSNANSNSSGGVSSSSQTSYSHVSQHTTPVHSPYSSSPSSTAYPSSTKSQLSSPLRRYVLLPPPKKKKLHKNSDLGYPGVFPQKSGQDEDQMTPNNVKTGYIDKGIIQNETVSAQGILADGLRDPKKLQDLGTFMVEVLKKRQESSKITSPSTFRPPSRATLNDQKKEQWMSDLAGTTPLRRLSKSVPHGFKGEKLLEALAQRQVPMLRATWYIKIIALSEMQAQRSRPAVPQHSYSNEWTITVNTFLKKQLMEINPNPATKPAVSALNSASGTQNIKPWASDEAKEKWETKWRYSILLTKWQYNEGLLDHRQFLRSTVEQLTTFSFEQVALLLSLISIFLPEYARSRLLMRLLIDGLLITLQAVQNCLTQNKAAFRYSYLELELKRMLQYLDKMDYTADLEQLSMDFFEGDDQETMPTPLSASPNPNDASPTGPSYQHNGSNWRLQVVNLCKWGITNSRNGRHRVYLVGTLLSHWKDGPLSAHLSPGEKSKALQSALMDFLDEYAGTNHYDSQRSSNMRYHLHKSEDTRDAIVRLFGNLIYDRLFSYQQYLQRLIARGDLHPNNLGQGSTIRELLQAFPLRRDALPYQLNQRRVILFGVNSEDEDKACIDNIVCQTKTKLPYMFSPEATGMTAPVKDTLQEENNLSALLPLQMIDYISTASRYCQLKATQWLLDSVYSFVVKDVQIGEDNWRVMTSPGSSLLNGRQFATIVCIMEIAFDFHSLYEVSHYQLQGKNILLKPLPRYIAFEAPNVPVDIRQQMEIVLETRKTVVASDAAMPAQIPELQLILKDSSSLSVSSLASTLYYKYGGHSHWPLHLFDGCIDALQKYDVLLRTNEREVKAANPTLASLPVGGIPGSMDPIQELSRTARIFSALLVDMAERTGTGCANDVVHSWLRLHESDWISSELAKSGLPPALLAEEADEFQEGQHFWFMVFMVQLVVQGFCTIETLVQDLCGSIVDRVARSIQPSFYDSGLLDQYHHDEPLSSMTKPDKANLRLCLTMLELLRVLLIDEPSPYMMASVSHSISTGHHRLLDVQLTTSEYHALQTQRFSRLQSEDQVLKQFQICRDLSWIEACLPLNHPVLHAIYEYRKDWALSADWLREKCHADVDGAYKMFLQTMQQNQQLINPSLEGGMINSNSKETRALAYKKHIEIVDRKMMETFLMLVAEVPESPTMMDSYGHPLTPDIIHQRALRSIFSRVDSWIFDRCKVEFWLLLDNVMLERRGRDKHELEVGSAGTDMKMDASASSTSTMSSTASGSMRSDGLMMMDGISMTSPHCGSTLTRLPDNPMGMEDGLGEGSRDPSGLGADVSHGLNDRGNDDSMQKLIHVFFQEFVLVEDIDKELLGRMLIGMRRDVIEEFIRYGYNLLAGSPSAEFPYNIMIVQRRVCSSDYTKIVANFHYVMETLLKEGQPAAALVLASEETASQTQPVMTATATPSAMTPSLSTSQSGASTLNNGSNGIQALASHGLNPAQLENRIKFAKSLLWQLKSFEDRVQYFDVMHSIGVSFEDAERIVQENMSGNKDMEDLLLNASVRGPLAANPGNGLGGIGDVLSSAPNSILMGADHEMSYLERQGTLPPTSGTSTTQHPINLVDLRTSLCLRLRLLVPLLPVVLQHPSSTACDLTSLVIRLTNLLVSSIIHGHGSEERLFEFCLDMVSCLMDEVLLLSGGGADSKAMRNDILNQLRAGLPQMTMSIPTVFASRIFRILPFQQHNVYFTNLRVMEHSAVSTGDSGSGSKGLLTHKEIQPRPWDWLEDCVGDVEHQGPIQQSHPSHYYQQPTLSSPAQVHGFGGMGGNSHDLTSLSNGSTGSSSNLTGGGSGSSSALSLANGHSQTHENWNDTSISLTIFGAKHVRKTEGTTYQTQFRLGHGGGDDDQGLLQGTR
ncbi:RNA polymerase II mediator complex subunit [Lunasporangiospora selenospora]|uniref:Mediator of RNA polymerase II transcription subunit 12 n=1 Tax=Lunasporangiospora selenospora TaxID=979761 RepID=A0A9P6G5I8_9FUNG|nr:RNA polymerase II mediator complex subunit [Lunasporangiospora selenospora]